MVFGQPTKFFHTFFRKAYTVIFIEQIFQIPRIISDYQANRFIWMSPAKRNNIINFKYHSLNSSFIRGGYLVTVIYTKKVWSRFVHLKRGSDKTRIQVNRNNPHTCIVECGEHANEYRWTAPSFILAFLKLSDFSFKDSAKTLSSICPFQTSGLKRC